MKCIVQVLFLASILITSCTENRDAKNLDTTYTNNETVEIPDVIIHKSLIRYDNQTSLWSLNDQPYSGYIVSFYPDSTLKEKTGISKGRKQNQSMKWHPDGRLKQLENYQAGKLHGEKKRWSSDTSYILIAHLNYHLGKAHGEQKQWYRTGELYKKLNMHMGHEHGIQQAFRKNGVVYANYEAKEGRIFGLKRAALCYGLEDEKIKYEN